MKKPSFIIGKKQIILTCMTLMLCIAVYVNYAVSDKSLIENAEPVNGEITASSSVNDKATGEYVYAQNSKRESDPDSVSESGEYVIIGGNGDKKALVRKVDNPEIMGVVVVCEGGESNVVKEKVYNAVSAAFGIPSQKIFVTGSK